MHISRRDFLKYCGLSAAALGLTSLDLGLLEEALASPTTPTVIWLHGASCTGCSVSFLNRISASAPKTAADVLITSINLAFHSALQGPSGEAAVDAVRRAQRTGDYILLVEGGVPTAFDGNTCWAWSVQGKEVTFLQAVRELAAGAKRIVCVGTCAGWGGMSAAPPNPTGVQGVGAAVGKPTINVAGCPPHPDWICWVIGQLLLGAEIALDGFGRPKQFFSTRLHEECPLRPTEDATTFGVAGQCLRDLGCRGPATYSACASQHFNGGVNWCIGANAPCIGCVQPDFPGPERFFG